MKELECQISQLDFDIEQEKQRSYVFLTPEKIKDYLSKVISGDIENQVIRKDIIKTFIREIILYNDKLIITFNFTDLTPVKNRDIITKDISGLVEEIDNEVKQPKTALLKNTVSYKKALTPPKSANGGIFLLKRKNLN